MKEFGESKLQQMCVKWAKMQYPKLMIFAIPNEGIRSARAAMRMKAEGMLSGVADLFLKIESKEPLFIEMKFGKNKQKASQKEFESKITECGCNYLVCSSFEDFKIEVEKYLK